MLQVIYGANQFAIDEALAALVAHSQVEPEYYDGEELEASALPELAAAPTLFASERLIIIRRASHNAVAGCGSASYHAARHPSSHREHE